jgi:hypothetical protein
MGANVEAVYDRGEACGVAMEDRERGCCGAGDLGD